MKTTLNPQEFEKLLEIMPYITFAINDDFIIKDMCYNLTPSMNSDGKAEEGVKVARYLFNKSKGYSDENLIETLGYFIFINTGLDYYKIEMDGTTLISEKLTDLFIFNKNSNWKAYHAIYEEIINSEYDTEEDSSYEFVEVLNDLFGNDDESGVFQTSKLENILGIEFTEELKQLIYNQYELMYGNDEDEDEPLIIFNDDWGMGNFSNSDTMKIKQNMFYLAPIINRGDDVLLRELCNNIFKDSNMGKEAVKIAKYLFNTKPLNKIYKDLLDEISNYIAFNTGLTSDILENEGYTIISEKMEEIIKPDFETNWNNYVYIYNKIIENDIDEEVDNSYDLVELMSDNEYSGIINKERLDKDLERVIGIKFKEEFINTIVEVYDLVEEI